MRLAIVGTGDLAIQVLHYAEACGYKVVGFFDDFKNSEEPFHRRPIVGKTIDIEEFYLLDYFDYLFIAIGYQHLKVKFSLYDSLKNSVKFATIVHPTCIIDATAKIGEGVIIYPGSIIDKNVIIEDQVIVNLGCIISHNSKINTCTYLSPNVSIAGFSTIGKCCFLGISTTVIDNVVIGDHIATGAGAVIANDIKLPGLYIGCPAKFLRSLDKSKY